MANTNPASLEDLANEFEGSAPAATTPAPAAPAEPTLADDPDAQQAMPFDEDGPTGVDVPFATDADLEADQANWPEAPADPAAAAANQAAIDQALVENGAMEPAPMPSLVSMATSVAAGQPVAEPPAPAKPAKAKATTAKAPVQKDWGKTEFRRWGTTSRKTGAVIGMYNADHPAAVTPVEPVLYDGKPQPGAKPVDVRVQKGEGRWVLVDRSHGTAMRGGNMDTVYVQMFSPEAFCPKCAKIVAGEAPKLAVAPRANSKAALAAAAGPVAAPVAAPAAPAKAKAAPKAKANGKAAGKPAAKAPATKAVAKPKAAKGKAATAAQLRAVGQQVLAEVVAEGNAK